MESAEMLGQAITDYNVLSAFCALGLSWVLPKIFDQLCVTPSVEERWQKLDCRPTSAQSRRLDCVPIQLTTSELEHALALRNPSIWQDLPDQTHFTRCGLPVPTAETLAAAANRDWIMLADGEAALAYSRAFPQLRIMHSGAVLEYAVRRGLLHPDLVGSLCNDDTPYLLKRSLGYAGELSSERLVLKVRLRNHVGKSKPIIKNIAVIGNWHDEPIRTSAQGNLPPE